jgi:hypothetical protein
VQINNPISQDAGAQQPRRQATGRHGKSNDRELQYGSNGNAEA